MNQYITLILCTMLLSCQSSIDAETFIDEHQKYPRVRAAILEKEDLLRKRFEDKGLIYPPQNLFIRVFKQERVLDVWTFLESEGIFKKVHDYPICRASGRLGPKRREGDLQIPEGFYYIDRFNPKSNFYLSLGINYPNRSDQILGTKGNLGGDIFLHGGCATIGCIPITDEYIKEVYLLAVHAKSNGQTKIPVHIFPSRLDRVTMSKLLKKSNTDVHLVSFWKNLQIGYQWFEKHHTLPKISVKSDGNYEFSTSTSQQKVLD